MAKATSALKTSIIEKFGTPCSVIDLDIVERNIKRAQKLCDQVGVCLLYTSPSPRD